MRTKSMILGAALLAAGVASSMAQSNVYSVNVVGYININLTNGFNLIANNLDFDGTGTNNLLTNVLGASVGINQTVYKFDPSVAAFDIWQYSKSSGAWSTIAGVVPPSAATLNPGEGAFVSVTKSTNFTVVGNVLQGSWTNNNLVGNNNFCIASPVFPLAGTIDSTGNGGLNVPGTNNYSIYLWDVPGQAFDIYQWSKSSQLWTFLSGPTGQTVGGPGAGPNIALGTSFFLVSKLTGWTNTFTVQ